MRAQLHRPGTSLFTSDMCRKGKTWSSLVLLWKASAKEPEVSTKEKSIKISLLSSLPQIFVIHITRKNMKPGPFHDNAEILEGVILYLLRTELCRPPPCQLHTLKPYPQGDVFGDAAFGGYQVGWGPEGGALMME